MRWNEYFADFHMYLGDKAVQGTLRGVNVFNPRRKTKVQSECIHVTFRSNDDRFILLQLTHSVSFKTLCV